MVAQTPPIAKVDYDTAEINTTLSVDAPGVLANDTDIDVDDILTVITFNVNGSSFLAGETASFSQGSIVINADGSYTFIPTLNYTGDNVPTISYTISDGTFTSVASLFLTVEQIDNLLEISGFGSCNQGFTVSGEYKVKYSLTFKNISTSRNSHPTSSIKNIDFINDLEAVFGNTCVTAVSELNIATNNNSRVYDYVNSTYYPLEFGNTAINSSFLDRTSNSVFNNSAINDLTLHPGQSVNVSFCVNIKPDCNGRPNPTPSGSGIDFNNVVNITSDRGSDTESLLLTDFHTTEAVVTAGLYIPEFYTPRFLNDVPPGVINSDGTYDYSNTVIITNEGTTTANNVNFNMGLGAFFANGISFKEIKITKVSGGSSVTINNLYDGNTESSLLMAGSSLAAGEKVILSIFYIIKPIYSGNYSYFYQLQNSQTQGSLDGLDETISSIKNRHSYVTWSDGLGNHLDRYYEASSPTESVSSELQCACTTSSMRFIFTSSSSTDKIITSVNKAPNDILEHEEVTFQIKIENTSESVQLEKLQLEDDLNSICGGNIVSVSKPFIQNSTATTNPTLNLNFDGTSDANIFDGTSGLLKINETITVEFTVLYAESCIGLNSAVFTSRDPLNNSTVSSKSVNVNASTDTDNDGIVNTDDLDDDNDTILDIDEYNGLNPLADDDLDFIPNYRDTDYDADANGDGIVDVFDFDSDGIPNHFDLDSDNDGILDIVEANNASKDSNNNGKTNNAVGANGFDNTLETNDSVNASSTYSIPNTDLTGNPNFTDIDADGDGIVDNIEAQLTDSYKTLNGIFSSEGIDTAFPNGINPIDTDNDTIFDYVDINSDNDIRDDIIEGWDIDSDGIAEKVASNLDADNDGLDDAFDTNRSIVNPTNGQVPTDFPNADNTDNPERDWREILAIIVLIDDITATEGEDFVFTIKLVTKNDNSILIESASPIVINFSTINGSDTTNVYDVATSPFDYNGFTNSFFTVPPLTNTIQFTVNSLDDNIYELVELFSLNGSITSNNTINNSIKGIGTLLDNDVAPSITMNNSREEEGIDLVHTITISHPCSTPILIEVNSGDILAISPEDYTSFLENLEIEGTIDPNNANTQVSFNISTNIDNLNELDEETLNVTGIVTSTNIGAQDLNKSGVILDIDPDPLVDIENVTVVEGETLVFTIRLLNENLKPMQNYRAINFILETIDDTTFANDDYKSISIFTNIPALTSSITQTVETINDVLNEDTETLFLQATTNLSNVSNTFIPTGTGFIKDDDYPNLFSPNSDGKSDFFKISGIEEYPNFKLIIVDRWGNEVYNYSNNGKVNPIWWNGYRNGKPVPAGVYFYTLDFNDGVTKPIRNFIELIR
ncbi:gliding motility-associated C-terminal domain-containing protein [Polaribacter sp. KT25b]|nr:gliding motility-associated C-terminal domain-containing protein [Polaribacter sp. KT25b]